jgi:hypothetical protein
MRARISAIGCILVLMASALSSQAPPPADVDIDHVILGINSLDAGIEEFARLTGVTAQKGGEHPGRGTQNALVSLGSGRYLEIIAPLPLAPKPAEIPFTRLTPSGWALHARDLAAVITRLKAAGFDTVGPTPGSRRRPDGSTLEWQTVGATGAGLDLAPFFIQWAATTPHPSTTSPGGCRLESLTLSDAHPEALKRFLGAVGYKADLRAGEPAMRLELQCPKGPVFFPGAES